MTPMRFVPLSVLVLVVVLGPAGAAAHQGHPPLPDDLRAAVTELRPEAGEAVDLEGVTFAVAPGGIGLTVTNTGTGVLEVTGEQAGEPLLRVTDDKAWVNQTSPQAKDVAGAMVDPEAVAELIDLLWDRVPADWVRLPDGGSATVIDHRGAPGHRPDPGYQVGDVVGDFGIDFTYDGEPYRATGTITAVTPPAVESPWRPALFAGAGLLLVMAAGVAVWTRTHWRAAARTA